MLLIILFNIFTDDLKIANFIIMVFLNYSHSIKLKHIDTGVVRNV